MSDYTKLLVWQKAHALALEAHGAASRIRGGTSTSLKAQICRAALSVPANIVEGREQRSDPNFARYLRIALGSASELEYHLQAARDLGLIPSPYHRELAVKVKEVRMMLHGMLRRLEPPRLQNAGTVFAPSVPGPTKL